MRTVSSAAAYNAEMSRSSLTSPQQIPSQMLERLLPALERPTSLHALLESGLAALAFELRSRPILYLKRQGKYVLYAAHGLGLSQEYAEMFPSPGQLERLERGEVLVVTTAGVAAVGDGVSCDGNPCMLGAALRSSEADSSQPGSRTLLGWVWAYQRFHPSSDLKEALSQFGSSWGAALERTQADLGSSVSETA